MMLQIALCCLEGSTMSNLVHRRRRCARIVPYMVLLPGGQYARGREGLSLFIALRWMQDPGGVMMWRTENIQACLRIFRRTQHQWLSRDILHPSQGVFAVFVLWPAFTGLSAVSVLSVVEKEEPVLCPTAGTEVRLIS